MEVYQKLIFSKNYNEPPTEGAFFSDFYEWIEKEGIKFEPEVIYATQEIMRVNDVLSPDPFKGSIRFQGRYRDDFEEQIEYMIGNLTMMHG